MKIANLIGNPDDSFVASMLIYIHANAARPTDLIHVHVMSCKLYRGQRLQAPYQK